MSSASSDDEEAPQVVHFSKVEQDEKERRRMGVKPVAAAKKKKVLNAKVKSSSKKQAAEPEYDLEATKKYAFDDQEEEKVLEQRLSQFERLERKSNFIDINPVLPPEREVKLGKNLSAAVLTKIPIITKAAGSNLREQALQRHDTRRKPLKL